MRTVVLQDGTLVEFTRQERATLLELSRHPGKLVYRDRLHSVVAGDHAATNPRNVDILISRLRQKLGDDARRPRFIATQHREGYVWVAEASSAPQAPGLVGIGRTDGAAEAGVLASDLIDRLSRRLPELPGSAKSAALGHPPFMVEMAFAPDGEGSICALALRHDLSGDVLATKRERLPSIEAVPERVNSIVDWVLEGIWEYVLAPASRNRPAPADLPLEMHIFNIGQQLWRPTEATREMEALLLAARLAHPDDARPAIMWGLAVYGRLVQIPTSDEMMIKARHEAFAAEIGELVDRHRSKLDGNALLKLGAAKLLWLASPANLDAAQELAESAYEEGTAFAAAFCVLGQIAMHRGQIETALELYDRAVQMAPYGSPFYIYLMVFKCTALIAAGDRAGQRATAAEMYVAQPSSRNVAQLMMPEDESELSADERAMIDAIPEQHFRVLLAVLYHTIARRFLLPEHQANIMRGMVRQARRVHGPQIISAEIAHLFLPVR